MKKTLLLVLCFAGCLPAALPAWSSQGHRTAALLAQGLLTPRARRLMDWLRRDPHWRRLEPGHGRRWRAADRELRNFCVGRSLDLEEASDWADAWSRRHPGTQRLHGVETPLSSDGGVDALKRACGGACVLTQLRVQIRTLDDTGKGRLERLRALLWVVNLMADLHQPLDCADNGDRGGAAVRVRLRGHPESLRRAWESDILAEAGPPPRVLAAQLLADQRRRPWDREDVDDRSPWVWATETFWVAKNSVYPQRRDNRGRYDRAELAKAWPVVRMQLARSGVRLAEVLNAAAAAH